MLSTLCWRRPICTILQNILLMCFLSAMLFSMILTLYLFYCPISLFHAFSMFSHFSSLRAKSFLRAVAYVRKHCNTCSVIDQIQKCKLIRQHNHCQKPENYCFFLSPPWRQIENSSHVIPGLNSFFKCHNL